jgi:hypothetical protein
MLVRIGCYYYRELVPIGSGSSVDCDGFLSEWTPTGLLFHVTRLQRFPFFLPTWGQNAET